MSLRSVPLRFKLVTALVIPMLVVAVLGLAANLVAFALLREGSKESLNVEEDVSSALPIVSGDRSSNRC